MPTSKQIAYLSFWLLVGGSGANASAILTGSATFSSGLWVYSYALNNTDPGVFLGEVSILTNSLVTDYSFAPVSHSDPPGWGFFIEGSGGSANPPLNESGTFWQWKGGLASGSSISGFSFATPLPPVSNLNNNYFLFSPTNGLPNDGIVEFGHIVAPDVVPEASSFVLVALGAAVIAGLKRVLRRPGPPGVSRL